MNGARAATAYREAGHVVVAWLLGVRVKRVERFIGLPSTVPKLGTRLFEP
jgi:hypothetical protein